MTFLEKWLLFALVVVFGLGTYLRASGGPVAITLRQEAIERGCAGYNRTTG